jgi:predicted Zn-ribbon and HTH transcriptional regulator
MNNEDLKDEEEERKPFWRCEECGYENHKKAIPKDRQAFYSSQKAKICPRCKSEALMPVGF